ncbi:MAG TPA: hypothetical protein VK539_16855 [Myxococcaceae bacterium]|nr:hypothetical protein [Myxococcaceae bacterium]
MKTIADELFEEGWKEGFQKGWMEGWQQGLAKGWAEGVILRLGYQGIVVDEGTRMRILACRDMDLLRRWVSQAGTATRLSDLEGL